MDYLWPVFEGEQLPDSVPEFAAAALAGQARRTVWVFWQRNPGQALRSGGADGKADVHRAWPDRRARRV